MIRGRSYSVRAYLTGLTLAIAFPLLAFSAFLVTRAATREQALMEAQVRGQAQATAMAIGQMLAQVRSHLFLMANSVAAREGDFAAFYTYLTDIRPHQAGAAMFTDGTGKAIFNTGDPFGADITAPAYSKLIATVAATGVTEISGLTLDPVSGRPSVIVAVPVEVHGQPTYVLSVDISGNLRQTLEQQHLPDGWIATVIDREGYIIGRSRSSERFVGELGRVESVGRVHSSDSGSFSSISLDGIAVENAFTHVGLSGWGVIIGIPWSILLGPVRESTVSIVLLGCFVLLLSGLLAVAIGWRITRPISRLVGLAHVVGHGGRLTTSMTGLRETDRVATSMREAGDRLAQSAHERDEVAEALRDSGERYRALAEQLALANHERQTLLHLTVQGQEDERRRIARELHDGLGQYLTALRLGLTAMEGSCRAGEESPRQLAALKALTGDLSQALGRMAWEIRPTALDDLGLQKAITQYLEEWAERSDLRIDQEIRIGEHRLPASIETTLFRVLQEAVTNVVKHACADHVAVILDADDMEVRLIVEDNGRGFAAGNDGVAPGTRHLGLLGMRERLALVHGTLDIESQLEQGTTLYIRVPAYLTVPA
jgi:signal transduction histidine kinase